jgi:hypothetical protein
MRSFAWCLLFAVTTVIESGCGKSGLTKVHGMVTFDGKPMESATVVFIPSQGGSSRPFGVTGPDGSFDLTTTTPNDGAFPGDYTVIVQYEEGTEVPAGSMKEAKAASLKLRQQKIKKTPKYVVPAIYGDPTKSPLKQKVPPDGPVKLEIHSK